MGATIIRPGSPLPLSLSLEDGDVTKFPQARVYAPDGTLLGTHDLTHRALGLYTNDTETMFNEDFVTVLYIVYNNAGHTVESTEHLRASEVFAQPDALHIADVVDGTITVGDSLARTNAAASGKVVRTLGNNYTYRNNADDGDLFTNVDNDTERTPL